MKNREERIKEYNGIKSIEHNGRTISVGDTVKAFNGSEWQKTGDIGDNSQFYQEAKIVDIRFHAAMYGTSDYVVDLQWKHNSEISKGHFLSGIKPID